MSYLNYGPINILAPFAPSVFTRTQPQYKCLRAHWINTRRYEAGEILTEGVDVPFGWVPTEAVDPLNASAAADFWAAGPRDIAGAVAYDLEFWSLGSLPIKPVTYWVRSGATQWVLTGLGASLGPRNP